MMNEAYDDLKRYLRDKEMNNADYERLSDKGMNVITSKEMKVGHIIKVKHNQRVPADLVLLYTTEKNGTVFIRTDQLDGETDWKLRKAVATTQKTSPIETIYSIDAYVEANPPDDHIYDFKGVFRNSVTGIGEPLSLENTLWSNTVLASPGYILAMIVYTGRETRSNMNSKSPRSKVGLIDWEINFLSKVLFLFMVLIAFIIVVMDHFSGEWYYKFFRYVLLLASIIPISLRVNLDMAKIYYSYCISNDDDERMVGTIARNSTIPEELGRI